MAFFYVRQNARYTQLRLREFKETFYGFGSQAVPPVGPRYEIPDMHSPDIFAQKAISGVTILTF